MTIIEKIGSIIFLTIIVVVYWMEIRFVFVYALKKIRHKPATNHLLSKSAIFVHFLAVIGIICFFYGYFVEPYWMEVKSVEVQTEKLKEVSFKIVHISDTHCDKKIRNEKKMVEIVNSIKPDIIIFTGDTINTRAALETFKETMKNLKANINKFAVRGNSDVWYWSDLGLFGGTGFKVLDHDVITIEKDNEVIKLFGISVEHKESYSQLLKNTSKEQFNLLLYHYPDLIEDLEELNIDLYLAGHTHGGQISLPLYGALITLSKYGKKYESGKYIVGDTILYINRGIGMEGGIVPRVRFWARPEITIINIVPKN